MTTCNLALLAILVGGVNSQVNRDPCLVCPDGVPAMFEGMAPDANFGDNSTCAELIAAAMFLESGTKDCAWADKHGLFCCPTVPNNPCIICPAGIMDGRENELVPLFSNNNDPRDETCALLSEFAKQFETLSNLCQMFGPEQESACCNSDTTTVDTADVDTTTDAPVFNADPCLVCPDGVLAGYDGLAPYAISGDSRTCLELIVDARRFESGTGDCAWAEKHELYCCPAVPMNPCIICPAGIIVGNEYELVPLFSNNNDPRDETCALLSEFAKQFETSSNFCQMFGPEQDSVCCNPTTTPASETNPSSEAENNGTVLVAAISTLAIIFFMVE